MSSSSQPPAPVRTTRGDSQVVFYACSFLIILIFGFIFDTCFYQAGIHARMTLNGKPLPGISQLFVSHSELPFFLGLLPWLGLVGWPLLIRGTAGNYWDPQAFVFRFLAFLSIELVLLVVLVLALVMPFVPYYLT